MKLLHHNMVAALALLLPGCALMSTENKSLAQVDDLVSWIERVHVESELSRDKTDKAYTALQTLTKPGFQGDAVLAHAELLRAVDLAEKQAKDLRASVRMMKESSAPVFARWARDIEAMATPELKKRSQDRLHETRARYDAIVKATDPTLASFDGFNRTLRDHALFLGHDFNPSAVAALSGDVQKLGQTSRDLAGGFAQCMKTTREYVDSAALPMRVEAARPQP